MKKILFSIVIFFLANVAIAANSNAVIVKEGYAEVPGGKVWYQVVSSAKTQHNIPLLILHGGPGVPYNYLEVFKKIADERPVIFYDQLGVGKSKTFKRNKDLWNIERYVSELEALVANLQLDKFYLFGHSWGGALAINYTLKNPDKVENLVLASPLISTPLWIADSKKLLNEIGPETAKIVSILEEHGETDSEEYKDIVSQFNEKFLYRQQPWPSDLVYSFDHMNKTIYEKMWGPSEFSVTGNLKNYDQMENLKHLGMPVLVTGGKFDEATPQTLKRAVKDLPKGKLIIYEKSAHFAFLEEEDKYFRDLRLFLNADSLKKPAKPKKGMRIIDDGYIKY